MDKLEGFRMYLETAESARLNIADAPEITTERFETLLPYAVALDVEKPWADAFAAALARAHPDDTDPMAHYQPRWQAGAAGRAAISAVRSPPAWRAPAAACELAVPNSSSSGFSGGRRLGRRRRRRGRRRLVARRPPARVTDRRALV